MTNITIEATESAGFDLPANTYDATVTDYTPEDGQFGPQVKFVFTLADQFKDNGENLQLWGWCSQKLSPKSKLWKWWTAIAGTPPVTGQPHDMSTLLNKPCRLFVNVIEKDGMKRSQIADVLSPLIASAAKAQRPASVQAAPPPQQANEQLGPCFICDEPGTAYDGKGREVCDKHASVQ